MRLLRVTGPSRLITARAFEETFSSSLAPAIEVVHADLSPWLDAIFGPGSVCVDGPDSNSAFRRAVSDIDFFCPDYLGIPFAPLLVAQRNRSNSRARLLLIAHAPAAYALEWSLLRPILRSGDLIIAPTESARQTIEALCPEISSFIRVAPHPIPPLPRRHVGARHLSIAGLSRLHPTKLLHRVIQAVAVLRERGLRDVTFRIAGPLTDADNKTFLPYALSLMAMIRRLGLDTRVKLVGAIDSRVAKGAFLCEADLVVNLSVSIEESFGKTVVEALGCGVPVIGTHWNGLSETIGQCGALVPVACTDLGVSVAPETIADTIQMVLDDRPTDDSCRAQADRSDPQRVCALYQHLLAESMATRSGAPDDDSMPGANTPAATGRGLLGAAAPLTQLSWAELFGMFVRDIAKQRAALASYRPPEPEDLRTLLVAGIQSPVERFLAGLGDEVTSLAAVSRATPRVTTDGDGFLSRVERGAAGRATLSSRLACLHALADAGRYTAVETGLRELDACAAGRWLFDALQINAWCYRGEFGKAFALCIESEDPAAWGELAAPRLRQLARVCREWQLPGLALPWLREWLEQFPDSPDSAAVWLARSSNALGVGLTAEARAALDAARNLLGQAVDLAPLEQVVADLELHASGDSS